MPTFNSSSPSLSNFSGVNLFKILKKKQEIFQHEKCVFTLTLYHQVKGSHLSPNTIVYPSGESIHHTLSGYLDLVSATLDTKIADCPTFTESKQTQKNTLNRLKTIKLTL